MRTSSIRWALPASCGRHSLEHGVDQPARAEAHRVVGDEAGLSLCFLHRLLAASSSRFIVFRATQATVAGRTGSATRSASSTSSERRDRVLGQLLDVSVARLVAKDEDVGQRAVVEAERHRGVVRVDERSLTFHPEEVAHRGAVHEPLGRAMKSATASTAIPHPAIAIPVWPVGTKTDARPRRFASRCSSSAMVFLPIAQSEPTVWTTVAPCRRFSPVGTVRPSGGRRRSGLDRVASGVLDELGIVGEKRVHTGFGRGHSRCRT